MCVVEGMAAGGLLENLGDPLGTRRRRDEDQASAWAREDKVRDAHFAHEQKLADKGAYSSQTKGDGNRSSLKATKGGY